MQPWTSDVAVSGNLWRRRLHGTEPSDLPSLAAAVQHRRGLATLITSVFEMRGPARPPCLGSAEKDRARLLLRCHGARVPALASPGVLSRQRPQLSIRLGASEKQTEPWKEHEAPSGSGPVLGRPWTARLCCTSHVLSWAGPLRSSETSHQVGSCI